MMIEENLQLKIALNDYLMQSLANLPSESGLSARQSFSASFDKRMRRLIRKAQRIESAQKTTGRFIQVSQSTHYRSRTRKRLLLVAIILSIIISVMSITSAREAIFGFFVRIYDSFSTIIFNQEPSRQTQASETAVTTNDDARNKVPEQIPEGYKKVDQLITDEIAQIYYKNSKGDELIFERQVSDILEVMVDTEGIKLEPLQVNQLSGLYYSNKGVQNLIWQEGQFIFIISGKVTKNELLNMAESLN